MPDYAFCPFAIEGYKAFMLCLTHESFISYLDEIEHYPQIITRSGKLLIDQLLVTGNNWNRYVCIDFKDGKLDLSSAQNVAGNMKQRTISVYLLHEHRKCLGNSILTERQRRCVRKGIPF